MKEYRLGKYGRMRRQFLKEHRPTVYSNMALDGTLFMPTVSALSRLAKAHLPQNHHRQRTRRKRHIL
ncbi:MAG: TnpV protein [Lachnospiraceae bacterium]|nr:TnpV protein [Lachnospiraceae bacterium]